jgi:hypothetical protein
MDLAIGRGYTDNLKYVAACCRNWRQEREIKHESDEPKHVVDMAEIVAWIDGGGK